MKVLITTRRNYLYMILIRLIDFIYAPRYHYMFFQKVIQKRGRIFHLKEITHSFQVKFFVNTDLILQKFINFLNKMHPLCDSLSYGNAYCQEKLRILKDIAVYWKGYTAESDFIDERFTDCCRKTIHAVNFEGALTCRLHQMLLLYWLVILL